MTKMIYDIRNQNRNLVTLKLTKNELDDLITDVENDISETDFILISKNYSDLHNHNWSDREIAQDAKINKEYYNSFLNTLLVARDKNETKDKPEITIRVSLLDLKFYASTMPGNREVRRKIRILRALYGSAYVHK